MDIIFNKEGAPLMFLGNKTYGATSDRKPTVQEELLSTFSHNKIEFAYWGDNNRYPENALNVIGKTGVLSTALNYKCRCCYGQGVVPMTLTGIDENNKEIFAPVNDKEILNYLRGFSFRNYHTQAFRDLIKIGNCFPIFIFNQTGEKILRVEIVNARHCRLSVDKKHIVLFGNFAQTFPDENAVVLDVLDESDPFLHLQILKTQGKLKGRAVAFPRIRNYFSNNDYYAAPDWDTAWRSGWIDVAHKIPTFLKKAYQNAMSLMWHIQIPDTFWEVRFPKENHQSTAEREAAINKYLDEFEENLTSEENPAKTLTTGFSLNESGKAEEKWIIERLENEIKAEERLSTSAAANSEILFSLMVNPSVLGAGLPGGPYSGNAGSGSDIREGLLVSLILNYIEKQQVLDPIELMFQYNGVQDVELMYRNIILTTLDTGKSTEEKLA
ncbi:hypothetical protein LJC68_06195 [Bacteroidales bacterium OttesenSCG-928-B11]|nr:hypothetical protein [Bacteroidales bacterium OttesenSCG-928-B11]